MFGAEHDGMEPVPGATPDLIEEATRLQQAADREDGTGVIEIGVNDGEGANPITEHSPVPDEVQELLKRAQTDQVEQQNG